MKSFPDFLVAVVLSVLAAFPAAAEERKSATPLTLVVMDPLALPLSCPCVQGYAQRDYEKLAAFLSKELSREVQIAFNESLGAALKKDTAGKADIVIGKHSVVLADAKKAGLNVAPVLALTGKDGQTLITGLIVVPATDPATKVEQLNGYRMIFGTSESDEKYAAALDLLKANKVAVPAVPETRQSCSDGATTILELGNDVRGATVISSYAAPLLEGCGTIKKGDLRVIGVTAAVPFVEAFLSQTLSADEQAGIKAALIKAGQSADLREALETKQGFVTIPPDNATAQKKS